MNLAEFHERVCELPLAQGEEKVRVTAVLLCLDSKERPGFMLTCRCCMFCLSMYAAWMICFIRFWMALIESRGNCAFLEDVLSRTQVLPMPEPVGLSEGCDPDFGKPFELCSVCLDLVD